MGLGTSLPNSIPHSMWGGGRRHHTTQANIPSTSRRQETQSMRGCFILFQMFLKVERTGRL